MILFIFLSTFLSLVNRFDLCIVGGSSGLGRELIYQSLQNNNKVLAWQIIQIKLKFLIEEVD